MEGHPLFVAVKQVLAAYMLTQHGSQANTFRSYQLAVLSAEQLRDILIGHLAMLEKTAKAMREAGKFTDISPPVAVELEKPPPPIRTPPPVSARVSRYVEPRDDDQSFAVALGSNLW